jgi:transcriptional antiterminator NusG
MSIYTLFLKSGTENLFLEHLKINAQFDIEYFYWLRREIREKKGGLIRKKIQPIFPSYIFWETAEPTPSMLEALRKVTGFIRILNSPTDIRPLSQKDHELILKLRGKGPICGISKAVFDENQRIVIIEGPLKELAGNIVKVDRRRKRVKVKLNLYNESFLIDFGFEDIKSADNQ